MAASRTCKWFDEVLFDKLAPANEVAAIIVEPIQGEGGYIVPEDGFLQGLRDICDKHGILLIADEVQSAPGRTGKMWAVEHWGVEPDILLTAKGIAIGMPLGAMIARAELLETWGPGAHGSTFGGNPVACAAALATIDSSRAASSRTPRVRGVKWDDTNSGTLSTTGSWNDYVTIRNGTLDQDLLTANVVYDAVAEGALAGGASKTRQLSFTLPDGDLGVGAITFTIKTDNNNNVVEFNATGDAETNNLSATGTVTSTLGAYANLRVTNLAVSPTSPQSGSTLTVTWNDANTGAGERQGVLRSH